MSRTPRTPQLDAPVASFGLERADGGARIDIDQLLERGPVVVAVVDAATAGEAVLAMLHELADRVPAVKARLVVVTAGAWDAGRRIDTLRAVRWLTDPRGEARRALGLSPRGPFRRGPCREGVFVLDAERVLRLAVVVDRPPTWIAPAAVASRLERLAVTVPRTHLQPAHVPSGEPADEPCAGEDATERLVRSTARAMGIAGASLTRVVTACRYRDLGMSTVPDEIITKAGPLTDAEWAVVREHPERSAQLFGTSPLFAEVRAIIRATHEHVDGSGYPNGLCGDAIPLGARIILAAESYVSLSGMGAQDPLAALHDGAGTVYDAEVVSALAAAAGA